MAVRPPVVPRVLQGTGDPVYRATEAIGDPWAWLILREASLDGVTRFNDFRFRLGIARETLVTRLDHLVDRGLLERDIPDYRLTPSGTDIFGCLVAAMSWGDRWRRGPSTLRMTHVGCGCKFKPAFHCSACDEGLRALDVTVEAIVNTSAELIGVQRHRTPNLALLERKRPCSIARTLEIAGDRWTSLTIRECFLGTRRFDDFTTRLGIVPSVLTQRLNHLVKNGFLKRQSYQTRPIRYDYRLTEMGLDYYPIPLSMLTWAQRWLPNASKGIILRHKRCEQHFSTVLACESCRKPVARSDILVEVRKRETRRAIRGVMLSDNDRLARSECSRPANATATKCRMATPL